MGGWVADGPRRTGVGVVAAATVAAVVSLGTGSAQATGSRPGSPQHGHTQAGHSSAHPGKGGAHGTQVRFNAAKTRTFSALIDQGREHVATLSGDTLQETSTPEDFGYRPTTATAVQKAFTSFLTEPESVQEVSHPMVVAHRPPGQRRELSEARFILPSVRDGAIEYITAEEDLSAEEATLTFTGLQNLERDGFGLYIKTGTFLRPLEARTQIWWPEGNNGRTREHIDLLLKKDTVNAQLLEHFYHPDVHTLKLSVKEVTRHITVFRDNKYDADNARHVRNIGTRINELVKFGLIKDHGQTPGVGGRHHQYSALTPEDIQRSDAMSLEQRIDQFAPPTSQSWQRKIVKHMYQGRNRRQVFDADRLAAEIPNLKREYAGRALSFLREAHLVEMLEAGRAARTLAKFRAFS